MTNEEAIKVQKWLQDNLFAYNNVTESTNMAIEALEQKPYEDWHGVPSDEMTLEQARQAVKDLRKMLPEYLEQNPNGDCISREDVLMALTGDITDCTVEEYIVRLRGKLSKLPPATPKEKTGHWIFDEILDKHYYCSECKSMGVDYWDYCPNCGSYNGGGDNGNE